MAEMYEGSDVGGMPLPEAQVGERDVANELGKVKNDLAQLRDDVSELLQSLVEAGKTQAQFAGQKFTRGKEMGIDRANRAWGKMRASSTRAAGGIQQQVQDRPIVVLGVSFIAGLLVGRMLDRS